MTIYLQVKSGLCLQKFGRNLEFSQKNLLDLELITDIPHPVDNTYAVNSMTGLHIQQFICTMNSADLIRII